MEVKRIGLSIALLFCALKIAQADPVEGAYSDQERRGNLTFFHEFESLRLGMHRSELSDILGHGAECVGSNGCSLYCESFEHIFNGWRYFATIHYSPVDHSVVGLMPYQSIPCGRIWCPDNPPQEKTDHAFCEQGSYKMERFMKDGHRISIGMERQKILEMFGSPTYSLTPEDFPPIADSFAYDVDGETRYLHVWYKEERVSSFGTGFPTPAGIT